MFSIARRRLFRGNVQIDQEYGCWIWVGRLIKGYGTFSVGGKQVYAHRYFYEFVHGPVPPGLELDHTCTNKACVRPHHLEAVTHAENMRRAADRGVWNGERNGNAKLTDWEVLLIKRALELDAPIGELAMIFNVSIRLVYYIIKKENWKHIKS
jgi:hypothetical protein